MALFVASGGGVKISNSALAKAYGGLALGIWLLMALGGSVRAMNAGLACPDWPLCFGNLIPDYHPQVYFEFIHRVVAGALTFLATGLAVLAFLRPGISSRLKWLIGASLSLLMFQIVLGGLTVLWQLNEGVVAAHLIAGTLFLALNLWVHLSLSEGREVKSVSRPLAWSVSGVAFIVLAQIALGGLVASHYAALVCTDFPKCQGQWFPTFHGIIGLHLIHRFGAYLTALSIWALHFVVRRRGHEALSRLTAWMSTLVLVQIGLGIANVIFFTPPLITVLHQATAVALFSVGIRAVFLVRLSLVELAIRGRVGLVGGIGVLKGL